MLTTFASHYSCDTYNCWNFARRSQRYDYRPHTIFDFVFVHFFIWYVVGIPFGCSFITECIVLLPFICLSFYFQTPCCNKIYTCRFCHDENESHCVNRKDVTELVCTNCDTRQKVQAECENCSLRFGKVSQVLSETRLYYICKMFTSKERKNYWNCDIRSVLPFGCIFQ
jgi:hypothetical protein